MASLSFNPTRIRTPTVQWFTNPFQTSLPPVINGKATEVNVITQPTQPTQPFSLGGKPFRKFTELYMPLERVLEKLKARGLLQPLEPRPAPNPLPKSYNENDYCHYHQSKGHTTNRCMRLRHDIQDLIDNKTISPPSQPNVTQNPLPTHAVPPPANINVIHADPLHRSEPIRPHPSFPITFMEMFHHCIAKGLITPHQSRFKSLYCKYHATTGHDTESCSDLRRMIQSLINQDLIKIPQPFTCPRGLYRSWRRFERDAFGGFNPNVFHRPYEVEPLFKNGTSQRALRKRFEARDPSVDLLTERNGRYSFYVLCPKNSRVEIEPTPIELCIPASQYIILTV